MTLRFALFCLTLIAIKVQVSFAQDIAKPVLKSQNKTLIVFFDGLRPDYITAEQMPNLFAFKQKAAFGKHHHSVFPTVTRVNSTSYATGSYPGTHGILGNAIYIPEVAAGKAIGTGYGDLSKIPAATGGPLLTAKSLGEVLAEAGQQMMVFSSGTTGQAFLQNHTVNGAVVNPDLILPETFKTQVLKEIGNAPKGEHALEKHKWIADALLRYGFAEGGPLVNAIWFSDPDGAAHEHGIGSAEAVAAIKYVDAQFGRIISAIEEKGLTDNFNVLISTDHGFVTHTGKQELTDFLIKAGFKKDKGSDDVVIAEGAIYVKNNDAEKIKNIVAALHKQEWVGAVFTKPKQTGDMQGWVNGTLSFDAIHYNHPKRAGDILVAPNWNDNKNDKGYAGSDFSGGVAGHGGSSPYEIQIAFMASGPDFFQGMVTEAPTSNVDIVPTVLGIYGLAKPTGMDGRAVKELYRLPISMKRRRMPRFKKQTISAKAKYAWGSYKVSAELSLIDDYRYFNFAKTERMPAK